MAIEIPENIQTWFDAQKFEVQLFPEAAVKRFQSLGGLYDFVAKEAAFWKPIDEQVSNKFSLCQTRINQALGQKDNEIQFQNLLRDGLNLLKNNGVNYRTGPYILFSETQFANESKRVFEKYGKLGYTAFLQGMLATEIYTPHMGGWSKGEIFGLFDAYVSSQLNERLDGQIEDGKTALLASRTEFSSFFSECEIERVKRQQQFETFCREYVDWKSKSESSFKDKTNAQLQTQQMQFDTSESGWKKRIADLEELYQKKLMLEAPVEYWKKLSRKHGWYGLGFSIATVLILCAMVYMLGQVLYKWPPTWLQSEKWDWNTLKGSFLLLAIASLAIYVVRFLAKFAISSYHLSRDAEERKQLTYVYLSLLEKSAVAPEHQQIILQALFSRADTGLLKGDHGPTMPSVLPNILDR